MTTADEEEWRPVAGFDGYEVSNLGRVRSWRDRKVPIDKRPKVMRPRLVNGGYHYVWVYRDGVRHTTSVQRAVLNAFAGEAPEPSMEACHNDGNSLNNRLDNLRWDTHRANIDDQRRHGTLRRGEQIKAGKLTEADVLSIHAQLERGAANRVELSRKYGVSWQAIDKIAKGQSWGWLTGRAA